MRTFLVILILAAVALALTNPGMDRFKDFAEDRSEDILLQETGDNALGRFLANLGGSLAGSYVDRITERRNYLLFSTYTVDLDRERQGDEWRFLGIAGQFLELQRPEGLNDVQPDR